jgi:hypothetical protein
MGTHHFTSQYSLPQNVKSHNGTSVTDTSHTGTLQNGTSLKTEYGTKRYIAERYCYKTRKVPYRKLYFLRFLLANLTLDIVTQTQNCTTHGYQEICSNLT